LTLLYAIFVTVYSFALKFEYTVPTHYTIHVKKNNFCNLIQSNYVGKNL